MINNSAPELISIQNSVLFNTSVAINFFAFSWYSHCVIYVAYAVVATCIENFFLTAPVFFGV